MLKRSVYEWATTKRARSGQTWAHVALALALTVSAVSEARTGRFERTNSRTPQGRSDRGLQGDEYSFLEFAPASGAGMGAACACATPTGAKGEALTFTRGSSATCTKTATGGLVTTGIADGDLVTCSTNQPRVEYDSAGVLGLLVETGRTNALLRSDALTNLAWADVGTPNATDGATDPFGGTTGDTLTDNDGAAFEGRSQAVTVTAAAAYIMSCYLKGTTSAKARLSLDGTTCDTSTLSSTTWSLVTCADASSSGVSISAQVLVGNATADTGDVVVGGCQVEAGTYSTSYMATGAASAQRLAEGATFANTTPSSPISVAASVAFSGARSGYVAAVSLYTGGASYLLLGQGSAGNAGVEYFPGGGGSYTTPLASGDRALGYSTAPSGSTLFGGKNGAVGAASTTGVAVTHPTVRLGGWSGAGSLPLDGIISRVCIDPEPSRCR